MRDKITSDRIPYLQDVGVDMQGPMCMAAWHLISGAWGATGDSSQVEDIVKNGWAEFERIRADAGAPIISIRCKCRTFLGATAPGS